MFARGGLPAHTPSVSTFLIVVSPHRIIYPPRHQLSPSQNTEYHCYLHPWPPLLLQAFWIPRNAPLPPTKSLLTPHSATSELTFPSPQLMVLNSSLIDCLTVANIQYRLKRHPLHYCCLLLVNIRPQCLGSRFLEHIRHCLASPGPIPLPICLLPLNLSEKSHVKYLQLPGNFRQQNPGLRLKE